MSGRLTEALGETVSRALGEPWTVRWGVAPPDGDGDGKLTTTGLDASLSAPGLSLSPGQVAGAVNFDAEWSFEVVFSATSVQSPMDVVHILFGAAEAVVDALRSPAAPFRELGFVDYLSDLDLQVDQPWQGAYDPPAAIALGITIAGRL